MHSKWRKSPLGNVSTTHYPTRIPHMLMRNELYPSSPNFSKHKSIEKQWERGSSHNLGSRGFREGPTEWYWCLLRELMVDAFEWYNLSHSFYILLRTYLKLWMLIWRSIDSCKFKVWISFEVFSCLLYHFCCGITLHTIWRIHLSLFWK